ncbi:MAG: sensor histidine kinase [Eubacterium sp.]
MKQKMKTPLLIIAIVLCISLLTSVILSFIYANNQYRLTSALAEELIAEYPNSEQKIVEIIKNNRLGNIENNALVSYGFSTIDFLKPYTITSSITAVACVIIFISLFAGIIYSVNKRNKNRIQELTVYLEQINAGKNVEIFDKKEDMFSTLQDEIYKTVTEMKIAKEKAVSERIEFADSLANIAHQIKTPLTNISLSTQIDNNTTVKKQIDRMSRLVESLLLMSKIDAGVIELKKNEVNVYTLLELSVEELEQIMNQKNINIELPNHADVSFIGDMEWSMEAFINIIKNCVEHTPENGKLIFDYYVNPLYTEITVKDNGTGFDKEDLKNMFKRFYQGKNSLGGIGIGLSIAKSIIEMQNGFITAENTKNGGAQFNIRFYCH